MSLGVSGYQGSAGFRPDLTLTGGRALDLGRAGAAASCYRYFITHLLIVANGDFTAPLDLVVSCSRAPMEGKEARLGMSPFKESMYLHGWLIWALQG